jgi:hypothetical protein
VLDPGTTSPWYEYNQGPALPSGSEARSIFPNRWEIVRHHHELQLSLDPFRQFLRGSSVTKTAGLTAAGATKFLPGPAPLGKRKRKKEKEKGKKVATQLLAKISEPWRGDGMLS